MSFIPFAGANDIGDRFLALLTKYEIQPQVGSSLEDELLSLTQLVEVIKNPALAQGAKEATLLRAAAGVHDLAAKVLSVEPIAEFPTFLPHLRLIAGTKISVASIAQNAVSAHNDDTARKMVELYLGCIVAHLGTQVLLDSPTNAKGDNPDVIFTVEELLFIGRSQQWALAVKTISSRQGQTIFERIKEGAEQIDRCPAERGMVVINTKNALDHDALWDAAFSDEQVAMNALAQQLDDLAARAEENRPQGEWDALFQSKTVRPILFLGQTIVRLPTAAGEQTPTPLKMLRGYGANGLLDPIGHGLADVMNDLMQKILLGIPGGSGQPPQ